jgi:hypothetical protein
MEVGVDGEGLGRGDRNAASRVMSIKVPLRDIKSTEWNDSFACVPTFADQFSWADGLPAKRVFPMGANGNRRP